MSGPWARRLLGRTLRQPDARSCGAAALVVARALVDDAYARLLVEGVHPTTGWTIGGSQAERFRAETLAMHTRTTGLADVAGRLQPPWPRWLGTPPWAVARQLSAGGTPYAVRPALWRRAERYAGVAHHVADGAPVALFVGDRWLPRHVVLVVGLADDALAVYDPARGTVGEVTARSFTDGDLPFGRWCRPWLVVGPARP